MFPAVQRIDQDKGHGVFLHQLNDTFGGDDLAAGDAIWRRPMHLAGMQLPRRLNPVILAFRLRQLGKGGAASARSLRNLAA